MAMLVWRIEQADGNGPYRDDDVALPGRHTFICPRRNPVPLDCLPFDYFYGCASYRDLRRWFWTKRDHVFWKALARRKDWFLTVYQVPKKAVSFKPYGQQIAFRKSEAKLLHKMRLNAQDSDHFKWRKVN
jgi:hypothetical protein